MYSRNPVQRLPRLSLFPLFSVPYGTQYLQSMVGADLKMDFAGKTGSVGPIPAVRRMSPRDPLLPEATGGFVATPSTLPHNIINIVPKDLEDTATYRPCTQGRTGQTRRAAGPKGR
jgi:hypothetical protein